MRLDLGHKRAHDMNYRTSDNDSHCYSDRRTTKLYVVGSIEYKRRNVERKAAGLNNTSIQGEDKLGIGRSKESKMWIGCFVDVEIERDVSEARIESEVDGILCDKDLWR